MRVYLAGPIHGCTDDEAKGWRATAREALLAHGCAVLDPMTYDWRGVEAGNEDVIVRTDLGRLRCADAVLVNAERPSWGTAMEVVYARQGGKRIVAFGPNTSPWLRHHATACVPTLDDALAWLTA